MHIPVVTQSLCKEPKPVHHAASDTWPAACPTQHGAWPAAAAASPCMPPSAPQLLYLLLAPAETPCSCQGLPRTAGKKTDKPEKMAGALAPLSLSQIRQQEARELAGCGQKVMVWGQGSG